MKRMPKALTLLALALALTIGATACTKPQDPATSASQAPAGETSSTPDGATDEGGSSNADPNAMKITVFAPNPDWGPTNKDVWLYKELSEKFNVNFDFAINPSSGSLEKFNLMIASGEVPDMVIYSYKNLMDNKKTFLPLNDLIESDGPDFQKLLADIPEVRKIITNADGNIYMFPYILADRFNYCLYVRNDWLQKLNIAPPKTLDDWYNMLVAFRDKDPNGNGEADEIPLLIESRRIASSGVVTCEAELSMFTQAWGMDEEFYTTDMKSIEFGGIDPRMKDALTWFNKLYSEKLVDQEYFVPDTDAYIAKQKNDRAGSYPSYGTSADEKDPDRPWQDLIAVAPPIGPAGQSMTWSVNPPFKGNNIAISAKASPDVAKKIMEIVNFTYTDEGRVLTNFGAEGVTYTVDANGEKQYTDEILNDPEESTLGMLRRYGIGSWWPQYEVPEFNEKLFGDKYKAAKDIYESDAVKLMPNIAYLPFTDDERSTLSTKYTDIKTYIDETFDNIITGTSPIDEFDVMVTKVKEMGIDDLVKIYNDALARWNAS